MTETQKKLAELVQQFADNEAPSIQSAFRDLLTDMRHVADHLGVDFFFAIDGSYEVYLEEKDQNK